jgi:nitrile hydratase
MASHHHHEESERNAQRAEAIESLLVEKGLVEPEAIDAMVWRYEREIGPMNGAKVVARAWVDPDYRQRLLTDAPAAVAELGFGGPSDPPLVVVANEPGVHNVICCTLCSCYPTRLLGISPSWYKDPAYRSRIVREPRAVLAEFGLQLAGEVEIRVWDSSAELRYMVLPGRPSGTEELTEEELAAFITRDALIGVAQVQAPGKV